MNIARKPFGQIIHYFFRILTPFSKPYWRPYISPYAPILRLRHIWLYINGNTYVYHTVLKTMTSNWGMKKFYIDGSREFIPKILLDPDSGKLEISGESYHEYTDEFFDPVFQWLTQYLQEPGHEIVMNFKMKYFNTASSKCFYEFIEMMREYEEKGLGKTQVNWYYEEGDVDMLEIGEDYAEDSGKDIHLIPYKKEGHFVSD